MSSSTTTFLPGRETRQRPGGRGGLERAERTILFVDVVEFGRLTDLDELATVTHWFGLVDVIACEILPAHGARLVKQLGDGLLIEAHEVPAAVASAIAIRTLARERNVGLPPDRQLRLRIGIEHALVVVDFADLHGSGVNLAARLAALAGPGEIVVSAAVRDRLIPSLDAEIEDLGPCYLKHRREPVRAFRIGPPGTRTGLAPAMPSTELRPTLAVLPFVNEDEHCAHQVIGEVVADRVLGELSRAAELNVIAGLSTFQLHRRALDPAALHRSLGADYVLAGRYRVAGGRVAVAAELTEARSLEAVWTRQLAEPVRGVVARESEITGQLVAGVGLAVIDREVERARCRPLSTLQSYTLLLGAVALMHRLSPADFAQARAMLEALIERAPRQCVPQAWLAKWHVLRVQQGWSDDQERDAAQALALTRRALDTDPDCSLALTMDGLVHVHLTKRLDLALQRYDSALARNPNDALGWLLRGTLLAFTDQGKRAVAETTRALKLSPLDPHRYYYDSLAAAAALSAGRYERALALADRSLLANRSHTSTLRAKAVAEWHLGRDDAARRTVAALLHLEPTLTVRGFLERSPAAGFVTGKAWARALAAAGVPA